MKNIMTIATALVASLAVADCEFSYFDNGDGTITLSNVISGVPSGSLEIPSTCDGHTVTGLGAKLFAGNRNITSVTIPDTVKTIGKDAFDSCTSLTTVDLGDGVETIGSFAFGACAIKTVSLPASLTDMAGDAFAQNPKTKLVVAADNPRYYVSGDGKLLLDRIDKALIGCIAKPDTVTIPEGVLTIGSGALESVEYKKISFPKSLENIRYGAIYVPDSMTELDFSNTSLRRVGAAAFWGTPKVKKIIFPATLSELCEFAFAGCYSLQEVHFLGSQPEILGESDAEVAHAIEHLESYGGRIPSGDRLFMSAAFKQTTYIDYQLDYIRPLDSVSVYVQPGQGWELIVAMGTWHERPIKYANKSDGTSEKDGDFTGAKAMTLNGLVTNTGGVMYGIAQIAPAKATKKGVKVSGFVMLEDGKKQSLKAVTVPIENGQLNVTTKVGKTELVLTITGDGFAGTLGEMTIESGEVGEDTGIISGTLKMSYFDAKTGKVKTKSIKLAGIASDGEAIGNLTIKGQATHSFAAGIQE